MMQGPKLKNHIKKIHRNLCHKSEEQLTKLFQLAKKDTPTIKRCIKEVCEQCNVCKRFKKTPPRPRVALVKAYTTNKMVSLDLKEVRKHGKEILYMIDEFSMYIQAEVIPNKKPETIMKAFNKRWVREGPGVPFRGIFRQWRRVQKSTSEGNGSEIWIDNISYRSKFAMEQWKK